MKKFGKELGNLNDYHDNKYGAVNLINVIFHSVKSQWRYFTHSFKVKYVVCSPAKVVLDLIELFSSTV